VGLRGEVEVEPLTDSPGRFHAGLSLRAGDTGVEVESVRRGTKGVILKLAGVADRDRADALRGRYLEVDAAEVPALPEGSYYHWQLVGLQVQRVDGTAIGELVDVVDYPANDVYVVRGDAGETLVPALASVVVAIDLDAGTMTVDMPDEVEVR
jgi:16S rRNA processing protein RimM